MTACASLVQIYTACPARGQVPHKARGQRELTHLQSVKGVRSLARAKAGPARGYMRVYTHSIAENLGLAQFVPRPHPQEEEYS